MSVVLVVVTLIVYWQVLGHRFIAYDDNIYVVHNQHLRSGLSTRGVAWAFSFNFYAGNWHPLTWLSHMLDYELYGLQPAGHHLTNLLLHAANTVLLFLVFCRMTRFILRSAFVAAVFAVHPLHVESVAWVAERKDVLSTFLWLVCMGAYVLYTERPTLLRYVPLFLALVLGLLAKPMLVTLPFALLLMDFWPLRRLRMGRTRSWKKYRSSPSSRG